MLPSAPMEDVLTTLPHARSRIPGRAAWQHRKVPFRLTASTASHCSSVILAAIASRLMPALLIRMSSRPNARTVSWTTRSQSAFFATSPATMSALAPADRISPATASSPSTFASFTATSAPSRANRFAVAAPMPLAPPVLHGDVEAHDPAVGPGGFACFPHRHLRVNGVAELDRRGEAHPVQAEQREGRALEPAREILLAVGDRERQDAVGDARAERRRLRELLVGVERVEVAREPGEARDVAPLHRAPARHERLAHLEVLPEASASHPISSQGSSSQ